MNRSTSIEKRLNQFPNKVLDLIAKDKGIKNTWNVGKEYIISKILADMRFDSLLSNAFLLIVLIATGL